MEIMVISRTIFSATSSMTMHRLYIRLQEHLHLQDHRQVQHLYFQIPIWAAILLQWFHQATILIPKECHRITAGFQLTNNSSSNNRNSILEEHQTKGFQDLEVFPNRFRRNNSNKYCNSSKNSSRFKQEWHLSKKNFSLISLWNARTDLNKAIPISSSLSKKSRNYTRKSRSLRCLKNSLTRSITWTITSITCLNSWPRIWISFATLKNGKI